VASPPKVVHPAPYSPPVDRYSYEAPPVEVPPIEEEKERIFPDPPIFAHSTDEENKQTI